MILFRLMESITEALQKIKNVCVASEGREKALIVAVIFLVGTASFGLGRISALDENREPVKINEIPLSANVAALSSDTASNNEPLVLGQSVSEQISLQAGGLLVGSKTSDKYHFPWCSGAKRIKEENKIYFNSIEEAKAAGYSPAGNCKGLE